MPHTASTFSYKLTLALCLSLLFFLHGCAGSSKAVNATLPGEQSTPLLEAGKSMYIGILAPFSSSHSEDYRAVIQHFKYMLSNLAYFSDPEQIHENANSAVRAARIAKADYLMLLQVSEWRQESGYFGNKSAKVRVVMLDPHTDKILGDNRLEVECRVMQSGLESPVMECLRPQVEEWKRRVFPGAYDLPKDLISSPPDPLMPAPESGPESSGK